MEKVKRKIKNYAFIDGQNLHYETRKAGLKVDYRKLRIYLADKYRVTKAYYLFGYELTTNTAKYAQLAEYGYEVIFKGRDVVSGTPRVGPTLKESNIDTELILQTMIKLVEVPDEFDKIVLVSGDGDFKNLVDYLIEKGKFEKILFPNKSSVSTLYKRQFDRKYYEYLPDVRRYIERKK